MLINRYFNVFNPGPWIGFSFCYLFFFKNERLFNFLQFSRYFLNKTLKHLFHEKYCKLFSSDYCHFYEPAITYFVDYLLNKINNKYFYYPIVLFKHKNIIFHEIIMSLNNYTILFFYNNMKFVSISLTKRNVNYLFSPCQSFSKTIKIKETKTVLVVEINLILFFK